jgi:hypothetical protein
MAAVLRVVKVVITRRNGRQEMTVLAAYLLTGLRAAHKVGERFTSGNVRLPWVAA